MSENTTISERVPKINDIFYVYGQPELIEVISNPRKGVLIVRPINELGARKTMFLNDKVKMFNLGDFSLPCLIDNVEDKINYEWLTNKLTEKNINIDKDVYAELEKLKFWIKDNLPELKLVDDNHWKYCQKLFKCVFLMKRYK